MDAIAKRYPGMLGCTWHADCGRCGKRLYLDATSPVAAEDELRAKGWSFNVNERWICSHHEETPTAPAEKPSDR